MTKTRYPYSLVIICVVYPRFFILWVLRVFSRFWSMKSGCSKGIKGLNKGKTYCKDLCDNIQSISKPVIRRLASLSGVKHISSLIYGETMGVFKIFLENVICNAMTYMEHRNMLRGRRSWQWMSFMLSSERGRLYTGLAA